MRLRWSVGGETVSDVTGAWALLSLIVLLVGAGLGLLSRLLLRGRSSITLSGSVLAGMLGSVIGGVLTQVVTGNPAHLRVGLVLLFSMLGTVAVLLVAERFMRRPPQTAIELIQLGESARVEFKSTARHNMRSGQRDDRIEAVIAKTLAGFLNTRGGSLLIGVDDSGAVLGLDDDLAYMRSADLDRYELWLHDYLTRVLGAPAVALLRVTFPSVGGTPICRVDAAPSRRPVFVRPAKGDDVLFFARFGNSTRQLSVADAIDYAVDHFHRRGWSIRTRDR